MGRKTQVSAHRRDGRWISSHLRRLTPTKLLRRPSDVLLTEKRAIKEMQKRALEEVASSDESESVIFALSHPELSSRGFVSMAQALPWLLAGTRPEEMSVDSPPPSPDRHSISNFLRTSDMYPSPANMVSPYFLRSGNLIFSAVSFDAPVEVLNMSECESITAIFWKNPSFNHPLEKWDTSKITNYTSAFEGATGFDHPLNKWVTSAATSFERVFCNATSFDQPLNKWDVSAVRSTSMMFKGATKFNQDLSMWDVGKVANMASMFKDAQNFDQNLGAWDISSVVNMENIFAGSGMSKENLSATLVGWAKTAETKGVRSSLRLGELPHDISELTPEAQEAWKYLSEEYQWKLGSHYPL